jgi:hypothetical protein
VRADDLIHIFAEDQVADLRPCLNGIDLLHLSCVPEPDTPVGSASTAGEEPVLMRGPGYGFDCSLVTAEFPCRFIHIVDRPHA